MHGEPAPDKDVPMRKWTIVVLFATCLAGCGGKSPADYARDAQAALDRRDAATAIKVSEEGLALDSVKKDAPTAWRLEQIRLEALAQSGKGVQVNTELERLATAYPKQVNASLYRSLADKAKAAGDTAGAIEILTS